jgi:3-hydroxybutyryl-CoA dehydrogenase
VSKLQTETADPQATIPAVCGVMGGGRMGAGIAHALLLAGADVVVVERDEDSATAAKARIDRSIEQSAQRGQLADAAQVTRRATYATSAHALGTASLVVEAVPEDLDLKREAIARIEASVGDDAVIATNTSSISLAVLGEVLERPQRMLGLHFFNPVPASKLIEVVITDATSPELPATASAWVRALGKTPIVVRNSPGFASSRLGVALGLEAIRMVEEGVASPEDIDAAMTLGYGHPTGPLRLTDLVGIDVRLGIAGYLASELGPRFEPPALMVEMVGRGRLGRKTGQGFYTWEDRS